MIKGKCATISETADRRDIGISKIKRVRQFLIILFLLAPSIWAKIRVKELTELHGMDEATVARDLGSQHFLIRGHWNMELSF